MRKKIKHDVPGGAINWFIAEPDAIKVKNGKLVRWINYGSGPDMLFTDPDTAPEFVDGSMRRVHAI